MTDKQKWYDRGFLRWKALGVLFITLLLGVVYVFAVVDSHVKYELEKILSSINGARVDIGDLDIHLFPSYVELKHVQVGHSARPMRNLLTIKRINFDYDLDLLFRKKIVIHDVQIEGIRYGTQRDQSGQLKPELSYLPNFPGLIDRVASSFYKEIRDEINRNPLRYLSQLSTGMDLKSMMRDFRVELKMAKLLDELKTNAAAKLETMERETLFMRRNSALDKWKAQIAEIKNPQTTNTTLTEQQFSVISHVREELLARKTTLEAKSNEYDSELRQIQDNLVQIESQTPTDVLLLRQKLGIPEDFQDLTPTVFGPKLISYLERLSYWADWARRRMPIGSEHIVIQDRNRGESIHYAKKSAHLSLMVKKGSITSNLEAEDGGAKINGYFHGFTIDPSIYGYPFEFHLEADVPSRDVSGVVVDVKVDHTKDHYDETYRLKVNSLPLEDWNVSDLGYLKIALKKARVSVAFESQLYDQDLKCNWSAEFRDVDYHVASQFQRMADIIKDHLLPLYTFEMIGSLEGPLDKLRFQISSELGRKIATGLMGEFRHQLGAIDDNLTQMLLDALEPKRRELRSKITEGREKIFRAIRAEATELGELIDTSDKLIVAHESHRKHARRMPAEDTSRGNKERR